jgi:hypothetical protein
LVEGIDEKQENLQTGWSIFPNTKDERKPLDLDVPDTKLNLKKFQEGEK